MKPKILVQVQIFYVFEPGEVDTFYVNLAKKDLEKLDALIEAIHNEEEGITIEATRVSMQALPSYEDLIRKMNASFRVHGFPSLRKRWFPEV
jgi:hypothetical protein